MKREVEIRYPGESVVSAKVTKEGSCRLTLEPSENESWEKQIEKTFFYVRASELKETDLFFAKFTPKTVRTNTLKNLLRSVMRSDIKDFWKARYDPSLTEDGLGICFVPGAKPALGKSALWWVKAARDFMPEKNSRLGNKNEYVAFLGTVIKMLVSEGWDINDAWSVICDDSRNIANFRNGKFCTLENTGSKEFYGLCDLANTYKLLVAVKDYTGFWLAGGCYINGGAPSLMAVDYFSGTSIDFTKNYNVGWVVLS